MGAVMRRGACAGVATIAVLLVLAWSATRVHFLNDGNWTALFRVGVAVPMPPELDAGSYRFASDGYDGQFYRLLAHDPFLTKGYARFADAPLFRFRRCLIPLAAWLLAFGQPGWIDAAYIAVEMIFIGLGAYWCARLLARRGRSPLWGLLFVVVPATLASFDRMLLDGPLVALFAGFLLYCEEERWSRVWILAMLAALTRETGFFLAAALVTDRAFKRDWRGVLRFSACAVPALAWYALLMAKLPPAVAGSQVGVPLLGILQRLLILRPYPDPMAQIVVRVADFLAVAGVVASLILAVRWLRSRRFGPVEICVGLYACLTLTLGTPVMVEAFAFGRVISPLLLWLLLEAVSRKAWLALVPPLLISLSVSLVFVRHLLDLLKMIASKGTL